MTIYCRRNTPPIPSLLIALLYRQWRDGSAAWIDSLQRVVGVALVLYGGWALFVTLVVPFLFAGAR